MSARVLAVFAVVVALAGCKLDRRSGAYACDTQADCDDGRTCDDGWCVEVGGGDGGAVADADPDQPDADPNQPDAGPDAAFVCPGACSSCNAENVCIMACPTLGACADQVVCPPGVACKVECEGDNSCAAGVDCTDAASCRIECNGAGSCAQRLLCGQGQCIVECPGTDSCTAGTDCSASCACVTNCAASACDAPSACVNEEPQCNDNDGDCTGFENGNCNSC
jgi:hypothetical protein